MTLYADPVEEIRSLKTRHFTRDVDSNDLSDPPIVEGLIDLDKLDSIFKYQP